MNRIPRNDEKDQQRSAIRLTTAKSALLQGTILHPVHMKAPLHSALVFAPAPSRPGFIRKIAAPDNPAEHGAQMLSRLIRRNLAPCVMALWLGAGLSVAQGAEFHNRSVFAAGLKDGYFLNGFSDIPAYEQIASLKSTNGTPRVAYEITAPEYGLFGLRLCAFRTGQHGGQRMQLG